MNNWLLLPPVAFIILFIVSIVLSFVLSKLSSQGHQSPGKLRPYACGEDLPAPQVQPDYSQFFPFAIFFTIMHVVALILATIPKGVVVSYGVAVIYLLGALVGLLILFRSDGSDLKADNSDKT